MALWKLCCVIAATCWRTCHCQTAEACGLHANCRVTSWVHSTHTSVHPSANLLALDGSVPAGFPAWFTNLHQVWVSSTLALVAAGALTLQVMFQVDQHQVWCLRESQSTAGTQPGYVQSMTTIATLHSSPLYPAPLASLMQSEPLRMYKNLNICADDMFSNLHTLICLECKACCLPQGDM